ncbi:pantoate--beta-alanine ligase [Alicyclobacillus macrosporangiidus]|uniref:Pantothenate synthetase n=1 Tax=Alicyclobacillus macrosporangiidus TaxID=392015 RepID=A0A1I7L947_9BACL|nr:pantoate--beta-alanine ligase [Alicyclobacillus macrosporangiidus]SFV06302.1 pantoate--beta-alanine ligase [Alicyclobacillus macrosporangiidus]
MRRIDSIVELRGVIRAAKQSGKTVGFVPTMGYLHEGHLSLVDAARRDNDLVVVSIFVNPLQFGPNEDLDRYPRDLDRDSSLLEQRGCDVLFAPSVEEMYPRPMETMVEVTDLGRRLCGKTRLTHFRGVATVVSKLFHIVTPDRAYFGRKDGQQVAVIRRMVQDLNFPVEIVDVPTVREPDGLAMSSRNLYLTPEERPHATVLYRALQHAKERILAGERDGRTLANFVGEIVASEPMVKLDYAETVYLDDLKPADVLEGRVMIAVAAYVGKARLIDNLQLIIEGGTVREI